MPTKIGAGDNPQEYDKNTGKYAKGTSDGDNVDKDFFRTAERTIKKEKQKAAQDLVYALDKVKDLKSFLGESKENKNFFKTAEQTVEKGQTQTKINKVHIEVEKDNVLPELNEKELQAMGITESKPVLLKKSSIERNLSEHGDIKPEDFDFIIGNTLYSPDKVVKGKNPDKDYILL